MPRRVDQVTPRRATNNEDSASPGSPRGSNALRLLEVLAASQVETNELVQLLAKQAPSKPLMSAIETWARQHGGLPDRETMPTNFDDPRFVKEPIFWIYTCVTRNQQLNIGRLCIDGMLTQTEAMLERSFASVYADVPASEEKQQLLKVHNRCFRSILQTCEFQINDLSSDDLTLEGMDLIYRQSLEPTVTEAREAITKLDEKLIAKLLQAKPTAFTIHQLISEKSFAYRDLNAVNSARTAYLRTGPKKQNASSPKQSKCNKCHEVLKGSFAQHKKVCPKK